MSIHLPRGLGPARYGPSNATAVEAAATDALLCTPWREVAALMKTARDREAGSGSLWFLTGVAAVMTEDIGTAREAFVRARTTARPDPRADRHLARLHLRAGELDEAMKIAQRRRTEAPRDVGVVVTFAEVLAARGERIRLRRLVRETEKHLDGPSLTRIEALLADELDFSLPDFSDLASIALTQARALNDALEPSVAIPMLERSTELQPTLSDALIELCATLSDVGRAKDAIAAAESGLARFPRMTDARFALGTALLRDGQHERAVEAWFHCQRLLPDWDAPYPSLILTLLRLGRKTEASEVHAEFARRCPTQEMVSVLAERLKR